MTKEKTLWKRSKYLTERIRSRQILLRIPRDVELARSIDKGLPASLCSTDFPRAKSYALLAEEMVLNKRVTNQDT